MAGRPIVITLTSKNFVLINFNRNDLKILQIIWIILDIYLM